MSRITTKCATPRRTITTVLEGVSARIADLDTSVDLLEGGARLIIKGSRNVLVRTAYGDDEDEVRI